MSISMFLRWQDKILKHLKGEEYFMFVLTGV